MNGNRWTLGAGMILVVAAVVVAGMLLLAPGDESALTPDTETLDGLRDRADSPLALDEEPARREAEGASSSSATDGDVVGGTFGYYDDDAAPEEPAAGGLGSGEESGAAGEIAAMPMPAPTMAPESLSKDAPADEGEERTRGSDETELTADAVPEVASSEIEIDRQQIIPLSAGEIDDNALWDDYLMYRRQALTVGFPVHDVDVSGRHVIQVTGDDGLPVLGAQVKVYAGQTLVSDSRTYATGKTQLFPNAWEEMAFVDTASFNVTVEKDNQMAEFTIDRNGGRHEWDVILDGLTVSDGVSLDVLFLIDATGSMSDEIHQLQSNILSISAQIDELPGDPDTRYGMVTYRDRGDDYITRRYEFTPDVTAFQADLSRVRANGGGDTPESLNEGLHDALNGVEWRGAETVKLVFLVADAAPHLDYADDYDYAEEMIAAAGRGIKIHPIASSGLDPQGEYIFRQLAQVTMGHFVFLTYEDVSTGSGGAPGDSTDLNVSPDDYTVEQLDELVLRLVTDELAALGGQV